MAQSTIKDKFQATIPLEVRPAPGLGELFGSLKLKRPVASTREEKHAAREAMAREAAKKLDKFRDIKRFEPTA
jgi:bifunctional DNA-binding transcriptional regulator/antitoxin component of YhaV-PrlF toxin-antitoxin module